MKILTAYPHAIFGGGSSYLFRSLTNELSSKHIVRALLPDSKDWNIPIVKYNLNLPFRVMGSSSTYWPDAKIYNQLTDNELIQYKQVVEEEIEVILKEFSPDVIHTNFLLPFSFSIAKVAKRYNIPVFVTSHGADVKMGEIDHRILQEAKDSLPLFSKIIAVSPDHAKWIKQTYGVSKNSTQVTYIPGGIYLDKFLSSIGSEVLEKNNLQSREYILGVGRLQQRKGFHVLIKAAKNLNKKVVIVGGGWEEKALKQLVLEEKLDNVLFIRFLDKTNEDELVYLMKNAFALVVPSLTREETLCFVALEGLASKTPVIASNIGGLSFVLDDESGILIQPNNAPSIVKAINSLNDVEIRNQLINNGYTRVKKIFTWENIVPQIENMYLEATSF